MTRTYIFLLILALYCQTLFPQVQEVNTIRRIAMKDSLLFEGSVNSRNAQKALNTHLHIPEGYEFREMVMQGKNKQTSGKDKFYLPDGTKFFVYSEETGQSIGAVTSEFLDGSFDDPIKFFENFQKIFVV